MILKGSAMNRSLDSKSSSNARENKIEMDSSTMNFLWSPVRFLFLPNSLFDAIKSLELINGTRDDRTRFHFESSEAQMNKHNHQMIIVDFNYNIVQLGVFYACPLFSPFLSYRLLLLSQLTAVPSHKQYSEWPSRWEIIENRETERVGKPIESKWNREWSSIKGKGVVNWTVSHGLRSSI